MSDRPCPLCAATAPQEALRHGNFQVLACGTCGSCSFPHPQPSSSQLRDLYGEAYFTSARLGEPGYDRYLEEVEHTRSTFEHRLRLLPSPRSGNRLLDVGAAIGLFVEQATAAGWGR